MKILLALFVVFVLFLSGAGYGGQWSEVAQRDKHGKIARSYKAKKEFRRKNPCPGTGRTTGKCRGYVIDHIIALKRGGADDAVNMQWQTVAEARIKDRWE